jgi:hypothetical protein
LRKAESHLGSVHRLPVFSRCRGGNSEIQPRRQDHHDAARAGRFPVHCNRETEDQSIPGNCFDPQFLYYSDRIRYTEQIERYRATFPAEQLKIIIHDDFKSNNEAVYDDVAAFLGLDPAYRPQFKTINAKVGVRFRRLKQASDQWLFPVKQWLRPRLPSGLYKAGRSLYRRVFFKQKGLPTLQPQDKAMLMRRYKDEVARLSACVGRDLTGLWGYDLI